ncbi:MAG: hypothetical protein Q9170_006578 [Blastenia crenularia]
MSKPQTPVERPDKTMSSRLLTMKFMQRAAASSPLSTLQNSEGSSLKRRKTNDYQNPIANPPIDFQIFQAAVDAADAKRAVAIERIAGEAGETKWVLSTVEMVQTSATQKKLQFLTTGYSDIDQNLQPTRSQSAIGRRSYGRLNYHIEKQQVSIADNGSSSSTDEGVHGDTYSVDEDTNNSTEPIEITMQEEALQDAKAGRETKKRVQRAEAARLAESRRSKEVKLNQLSSISSGGGAGAGTECHFCGQKGHMKASCPRKAKLEHRKEDR